MKISQTLTADDCYGQPWPPPGNGWVVIRRVPGFTLWRSIQFQIADRKQTERHRERAFENRSKFLHQREWLASLGADASPHHLHPEPKLEGYSNGRR